MTIEKGPALAGPLLLFKTTAHVVAPGRQILKQFRILAEVHERDGIKWADISPEIAPLELAASTRL